MWEIKHSKSAAFYDRYERKGGNTEITHYCPGCGHGVLHKLIAEAIDDLGIQDRSILVGPVGCSIFMYYYMDVGNISASHGRAPAVATGVKRMRPDAIVFCYQGDGDLAAIGGNEILHAANRGEDITVFFINNGIYGMTGGQMAPTTPIGQKTTTSPRGRAYEVEGPPLRVCELLATLDGPSYIERVALTDAKNHMRARKAVRKAFQNQIEKRGFSFVEVLTACPSGWKVSPTEAIHWVEKNMIPVFPLNVFRDRDSKLATPSAPPKEKASSKPQASPEIAAQAPPAQGAVAKGEIREVAMTLSGFGGQGVLFAGLALAEGALRENLQVSWIPSYGPEMRGGTAHCHVRVSKHPIPSPWISRPSSLLAFNQPSIEKFAHEVLPGGLILANSSMIDALPDRSDVQIVGVPAYETATNLGNAKNANLIMLGAYLEITGAIDQDAILSAFVEKGVKPAVLKGNREAIEAGRRLVSGTRLNSNLA
ncbi:MAG: 2-oxoacid:acceptor oxidoreductase family protein [Acidobacteria bacterium]|nr:2-oxoacid:acceptor oxidoreductase family protein [Acidobacteriota bacterium]